MVFQCEIERSFDFLAKARRCSGKSKISRIRHGIFGKPYSTPVSKHTNLAEEKSFTVVNRNMIPSVAFLLISPYKIG